MNHPEFTPLQEISQLGSSRLHDVYLCCMVIMAGPEFPLPLSGSGTRIDQCPMMRSQTDHSFYQSTQINGHDHAR